MVVPCQGGYFHPLLLGSLQPLPCISTHIFYFCCVSVLMFLIQARFPINGSTSCPWSWLTCGDACVTCWDVAELLSLFKSNLCTGFSLCSLMSTAAMCRYGTLELGALTSLFFGLLLHIPAATVWQRYPRILLLVSALRFSLSKVASVLILPTYL